MYFGVSGKPMDDILPYKKYGLASKGPKINGPKALKSAVF